MTTITAHPKTCLTPAEYLALERAAERKSEYLDGEMVPMPGASRYHNLIVTNLLAELHPQLKGRPCEVYPSDMRLWVPATGLYTYPDVTVVVGEPALVDDYFDMITNPAVLIEILSPSTEKYDRGRKFDHYGTLPALREYLLVAQDQPLVEQFVRDAPQGDWRRTRHTIAAGLDGIVVLPSIGCRLALAEVYDRVVER
jgi:Uma2 family endonuclease